MERRQLLRTTGVALAAGLAGCGGGDDGEDGDGETTDAGGDGTTEAPPDTPAETQAPTETEAPQTATETQMETPTQTETPAQVEAVDVVIDNVGVSAWVVESDESGSVAPTGEENPTMTFQIGTRYAIENRGWSSHPFALRAADDSPLLSQSAEGAYEGDADVNWTDNGDTLAFTMTDALAAELNYYICTVHAAMQGTAEGV